MNDQATDSTRSFAKQIAGAIGSGLSVTAYNRLALAVMHIVAARSLGSVAEYGVFAVCVNSVNLIALLSSLGWHQIITRLVAQYHVQRDWGRLRGAMIRAFQITVGISLTIAVIGLIAAVGLRLSPAIRRCTIIAMICLPLVTIRRLRFCELIGFHRTNLALLLEEGAIPTIVVLAIIAFGARDAGDIMRFYALSCAVLALLMTVELRQSIPIAARRVKPEYETKPWFGLALPVILGQSGSVIMQRSDVLMIAPMLGASAVGLYSSAARIVVLLGFLPASIGAVMRPKFATAYFGGHHLTLKKLFIASLAASACLAIPLAMALILFPEQIVSLAFGSDYSAAAAFLFVLVLGQFINALTGPVAGFLLMTGGERILGWSSAVAMVVNIAVNLYAIPRWGLMGAAAGTTLAIIIQNGWRFLATIPRLGQVPENKTELAAELATAEQG